MNKRKMYESVENIEQTISEITNGLRLILREWDDSKFNFSTVSDNEIEDAVDVINIAVRGLKNTDYSDLKTIVRAIENDRELNDILDDVYILNNGTNRFIIAECYVISDKKLSLKERKSISFSKLNVTIKPEVETGRDVIRIYIKVD